MGLAAGILGVTALGIATAVGLTLANAVPFLGPVIDPIVISALMLEG